MMETTTQANETQFNQQYYSDELTQFAESWKDDEGLMNLLNFITPKVPVARRFDYKKTDHNEMFFSEVDDLRNQGSGFKRIEFTGTTVQAKTLNKGLTVRVDTDDIVGEDWQERYVHLLMKRLLRNELRRAVWALKMNATVIEKTWGANSQPDIDIRETLLQSSDLNGFYPNRVLFGELAWYLRQDCYALQNNAGARISSEMTRANLAEKLLVDDVQLLRKQSLGVQGSEINGNEIFAFYGQNGLLKDEPSHMKRFVTPIENNQLFRVYVEPHTKFVDVTVEHYSNIVVTSPQTITQLTVKQQA